MCVFLVDTEQKGGTTLDSSIPNPSSSSVPAHNLIPPPSSKNVLHPSAESQSVTAVNENLNTHKTPDKSLHPQSVHQAEVFAVPHSLEESLSHDHHWRKPETLSSENEQGGSKLDQPPLLSSAVVGADHALNPEISTYQSVQTNMMVGADKSIIERQMDNDTSPAAAQTHDNHLLGNLTQTNTDPQLSKPAASGTDSAVPADQNDNSFSHKLAELEKLLHTANHTTSIPAESIEPGDDLQQTSNEELSPCKSTQPADYCQLEPLSTLEKRDGNHLSVSEDHAIPSTSSRLGNLPSLNNQLCLTSSQSFSAPLTSIETPQSDDEETEEDINGINLQMFVFVIHFNFIIWNDHRAIQSCMG